MVDIPIDGEVLEQALRERFQCARCGHCCKGDGIVRFGGAETDRMAQALGVRPKAFLREYAVKLDSRQWILRDRLVPGPAGVLGREKWCIFLERHPDGRYACRLGDAKPRQCVVFPAEWINPDSFQTCAGLRLLASELRREAAVNMDPENAPR